MTIDPSRAARAAGFTRLMTRIRCRRVLRLIQRGFAVASAAGAAPCATDGTGKTASVLKWGHGSSVPCDVRFDWRKDSLPIVGGQDLPRQHLRIHGLLHAPGAAPPAPVQRLLAQMVALLP